MFANVLNYKYLVFSISRLCTDGGGRDEGLRLYYCLSATARKGFVTVRGGGGGGGGGGGEGGQKELCHCHKYFSTHQLLPTHPPYIQTMLRQNPYLKGIEYNIGFFSNAAQQARDNHGDVAFVVV